MMYSVSQGGVLPLVIIVGIVAAAVQILIFFLESFAWTSKRSMSLFGIRNSQEAETTKFLAFNQGFYNLFLAVLDVIGLMFLGGSYGAIGVTLLLAGCGSAFLAAVVLFCAKRELRGAAIKQGIVPLIELVLLLIEICVSL